jgi:hypothetical protein
LSYWQAVETIETLFGNPQVTVISADVNEIVPQDDTPLTQFTAACLATKIVASHLRAREHGRWNPGAPLGHLEFASSYFSELEITANSAF